MMTSTLNTAVNIKNNPRDYVGIAKQYSKDILSGKIVSNKWTKLACQRFERDLVNESLPYYLDEDSAGHVCFFVELLKHYQGPKANQNIILMPWQVFILVNAFGWLKKDGDKKDKRRFKKVYVEVARSNGKSTLSSALALYMLAADDEQGSEVYAAASSRDQAMIVFRDARAMAFKMPPGLASRLKLKINKFIILAQDELSFFKPLSAEGNSLHGLKIHFAVIDEVHVHKTRDVWDTMMGGLGKRPQSMLWAITTAGSDLSGIGYEAHNYAKKVLERTNGHEDDEQFAIIYSIDEDDDWLDESCWMKANPNWIESVDPDDMRSLAREAKVMSSKQPSFKTTKLNLWLNSSHALFDMTAWQKCLDKDLKLSDFRGQDCHIGLDLASKSDIAALSIVFRKEKDVYCFPIYYLPEKAVTDGKISQYKGWVIDGYIRTTPGNITDFAQIEDDLLELAKDFNVKSINFDPWQAASMIQSLQNKTKIEIVEVSQNTKNLSEPCKELDSLTISGRFHFNCPVLMWMASNTIGVYDKNENVYPHKERPQDKIDGISATLTAMTTMLLDQPKPKRDWSMFGVVDKNGFRSF
jgi:phage terminase large subunit-like protein